MKAWHSNFGNWQVLIKRTLSAANSRQKKLPIIVARNVKCDFVFQQSTYQNDAKKKTAPALIVFAAALIVFAAALILFATALIVFATALIVFATALIIFATALIVFVTALVIYLTF